MHSKYHIPLLIIVGIVLYINCLNNQMFWDDEDFILKNLFIRDWHCWTHFFTDNVVAGRGFVSNYWRPLLLILFSIEWHLWKDWVYGYHAVSILLHITVGILLYRFIIILKLNRQIAFFISIIWLAHPLHDEVVVYPNSVGDSLAAIFILLGLINYRRNYWISIICYPLAIMSKETGIVLMPLILLREMLDV